MNSRVTAGGLFVAGLAVGVFGRLLGPQLLVWIVVVVLLWAAVTVWVRGAGGVSWRVPTRTTPIAPGENPASAVKLTLAPNVPMAEMLCHRLRQQGIESFLRPTAPWGGGATTGTDPAYPAEVWVSEADLKKARTLIG